MREIWKFELSTLTTTRCELPFDPTVLTVQMQRGKPCLWVIGTPSLGRQPRLFTVVGTGWQTNAAPEKYVGTVQDGEYVWHVFEHWESPEAREGK